MRTLIFDIETVGESWEMFDPMTQSVLSRWVERTTRTSLERHAGMRDLIDGLGFSPLTGTIVAIGVFDLELNEGVVYYVSNSTVGDTEYGNFTLKVRSEKEMLESFWEGALAYDVFVSFNGRSFDVPFLNLRSAIHAIRPSRDLMEGRYLYQQKTAHHIDLEDQFTFYGAMHRRPSLHLFCRSFGIESPKCGGISGDDVHSLFEDERFLEIAQYNAGDLIATAALYEKWFEFLAPEHFKAIVSEDMTHE